MLKKTLSAKTIFIFLSLLVVIITGVLIINNKGSGTTQGSTTEPIGGSGQVPGIVAQKNIQREFSFPIPANDESFTYTIISAEKRETITVKGQQARANSGKIFLLINLKITNPTDYGLRLQTRDYIRLSANKGKEWLAPELHNDPVEAQAISTKYTRLGFAVDTSQKEFTLRIGEINGEKTTINLQF
jgi:hypothetical protein